MKNTALVLIDIQNIYFTPGKYLLHEPEKAATNARKILDAFREQGLPIIHVKHAFGMDGYKEEKETLNEIHSLVYPKQGEIIVNKNYPNSFLHTNLQECLLDREIENLVIVGMMSHMCIDTTVRACQNYHYHVTVIDDACTTKDLFWNGKTIPAEVVHQSFMAGLNGMFANLISTELYLDQMK